VSTIGRWRWPNEVAVSDRFIDETSRARRKSQGHARGRGTAADLIGWALAQRTTLPRRSGEPAAAQGQDVANQFHLGELARAQNRAAPAITI
jgi:hypothetical protein